MTMFEACEIAKKTNPKEMWLTHYSPSLIRPKDYLEEIQKIFPNTKCAKDGWSIDLQYED